MTIDEWEDKFIPIKNHITEENGFDGCLYETYGSEHDHIYEFRNMYNIWTLVETNGVQHIINGYHVVNRLGYFLTQFPANPSKRYEIHVPQA